jgi:hypothetical protein
VYRIPPDALNLTPRGVVLADFPEALRRINAQASLFVQREAVSLAPRDTSALARSIQARVTDLTVVISVPSNQPTSAYADVMEQGRRPGTLDPATGRLQSGMPPVQAMAGWFRRHGIPQSEWYVVARSIGRRGITGRFFMRRAYERLRDHELPAIVSRVLAQMGI